MSPSLSDDASTVATPRMFLAAVYRRYCIKICRRKSNTPISDGWIVCHDPELPRRIPVGVKVRPRFARDAKVEIRSDEQASARRAEKAGITKVRPHDALLPLPHNTFLPFPTWCRFIGLVVLGARAPRSRSKPLRPISRCDILMVSRSLYPRTW